MTKLFMLAIMGLGLMLSNSLEAQTSYSVNISGPFPCLNYQIITTGPGGTAQLIPNTNGSSTHSLTGIPSGGGPHGEGLFERLCGGSRNYVWDPALNVEEWIITYDYCCSGDEYEVSMAIQHDYSAGTKTIFITSTYLYPCEYEGCTIK